MTFELLWSNRKTKPDINPAFLAKYDVLGTFYEHRVATEGFTFLDSQLEEYVNQYGADPATDRSREPPAGAAYEIDLPEWESREMPYNWSGDTDFIRRVVDNQIVPIPIRHKNGIDRIIKENYRRFRVYKLKSLTSLRQ